MRLMLVLLIPAVLTALVGKTAGLWCVSYGERSYLCVRNLVLESSRCSQ